MDPRYSITGLLVGFLVGLTGMGGGSLMTPLLILVVGVRPTVAVGSDLACAAVTKIVGAFQHRRQGTVDFRLARQMAAGSIPGSLLGVWCVHHLQRLLGDNVEHLVVRLLGVMLILVAIAMLLKSHPRVAQAAARFHVEQPGRRRAWASAAGLLLGFLVGVTSVGSGTLFGVLLLAVFGLSAREMVGTDIYHAALLTLAAAGAHVWAHNVDYALVGNLLLGSIPGVLLGSRLAVKMPEKALRPVLAGLLFLSGLKMI
jgi:uncharacterized membrane protein YfcA